MKNKPRFNVICRLTGATLFSSGYGRPAFAFAQRGVYGTHVVEDVNIGTMRQRTPADVRVMRDGETITPDLTEEDLKRRRGEATTTTTKKRKTVSRRKKNGG